ncbi:MAG: hypothetical protein EOO20_11710 [Chryseobacterium sp.]|nr:MAG: hypothetical protein EOO20_11710 [Chryseobacterium sp.]
MENEKNNQNGASPSSIGAKVPKGEPNNEGKEIKEGNPDQQRPVFGSDGGNNTAAREDQLPSLDNGASKGADADTDKNNDSEADEKTGSDADQDRDGKPSI